MLGEILKRNFDFALAKSGRNLSELVKEYLASGAERMHKRPLDTRKVCRWIDGRNPNLGNIARVSRLLGQPAHLLLDPGFVPGKKQKIDGSLSETLTRNVRSTLMARRISMSALARKRGVSGPRIHRFMSYGNPRLDKIEFLADLLGLSAHILLDPSYVPEFPEDG